MHPVECYELNSWRNFDKPRRKKKKLSKRQRILAGTIMNNLTKEQIELTIKCLQEQLAAFSIEEEPEITQWEPKGGDWYIRTNGEIANFSSTSDLRLFGSERSTEELAEQAAINMRKFNRLLAYRDEAFEGTAYIKAFARHFNNAYIVYNHINDKYDVVSYDNLEIVGMPCFAPALADTLVQKLNSGEVVL